VNDEVVEEYLTKKNIGYEEETVNAEKGKLEQELHSLQGEITSAKKQLKLRLAQLDKERKEFQAMNEAHSSRIQSLKEKGE